MPRLSSHTPPKRPPPKRRRLAKLLPVVLATLAATVGWRVWQQSTSPERLLEPARQAMEAKQYAAVEKLCERILAARPQSAEALLLAGEAAAKQGHLRDALGYYDRFDAGDMAVRARNSAGDIWLTVGHASKAEAKYRQALAIEPQSAFAHERLALLLSVENRRFESLPHLYELLRQGRASYDLLLFAGDSLKPVDMPDELARFRAAAPDDPAPLIGRARVELRQKNYTEAARLARQVIAAANHFIEAHATLGRALLQEGSDDELDEWAAALPPDADAHPDVWLARAGWARRRGQTEAAARCLWEALRRDANHQAATLQLSQALEALGESAKAKDLAERAAALSDFSSTIASLADNRRNPKRLRRVAMRAEKLGRLWEAWNWNRTAISLLGDVRWAREAQARIEPNLNDALPPTLPQADFGIQLDLSHYPLPSEPRARRSIASSPLAPSSVEPRFEDLAQQAGIDFRYRYGQKANEPRARMFQMTGGGVAVVDYDLDGWPDLYFTQGCRWPPQAGQTEFLDELYRNLGNGRFEKVTPDSRLGDDRFSQGATVGDFNSDGFPDLYVANIGVNRLYANNGDGTFTDVSEPAGISADRWTTSCVMADLNADGLPDLYDVNYLQGQNLFEQICHSADGVPRTCGPRMFEAAPDNFLLNRGDGRFEEMTELSGMGVAGGNGLGVVAADFGGAGRLSLFVANDQDANFYFVNRTPSGGDFPRFEEWGAISGLAYDGLGRAQACMGVAAGDANGDGKVDLFVTNFAEEANALYVQQDDQSFIDLSGPSRLAKPSFAMLGFGTQFLDGELDGLVDLVVTNGHVHDFPPEGVSGAMPPQYFRNVGGGQFQEIPAKRLGDYFRRTYFGRGMARLDWNRDGREDFVVTSLDAPVALLTNRTEGTGHYLAVQMRGVKSSRDAIGAAVTINLGDRVQRQWLTAGDGYLASNQRQLVFGLGASTSVDRLRIVWPSGVTQEFSDVKADQELIVVENSALFAVVPR